MGGVASDLDGRTSLPGLWVAGEVGSTGLHGANRLASNSLLEAVVVGARVAEALTRVTPVMPADGHPVRIDPHQPGQPLPAEQALIRQLRQTMTAKVGVVRDGAGLKEAVTILQGIGAKAKSSTLINMATSALLVATAALNRRESRGGHFRSDYPQADPRLARRTFITLSPPQNSKVSA
jgi:L-aspartate oxidase